MPVKGIELKAGQTWKTKSGMTGTLGNNARGTYPFVIRADDSNYTYTMDGRYIECEESPHDLAVMLSPLYRETFTLEQLGAAFEAQGFDYGTYMDIAAYLSKQSDPEYKEYLRLKEKFKGDEE